MRKFFLILFLFCFVLNFAYANESDEILRKKISQMLIVGFNGVELNKNNPIYDDIVNERISGVILFSRDTSKTKEINGNNNAIKNIQSPRQLKKLIKDIKKINKNNKLFIALDEEGGKISRLEEEKGFKNKTLSHKKLGEINNLDLTYKEAKKIAKILKKYGFNFNFAPCVDLALNKNSKVIYQKERSFSSDPKVVVEHSRKYIEAHDKYNILTSIKHFPGHGSVSGDTHKGFVDASDCWVKEEIYPFQELIKQNIVKSVMISHIFNKNFDEKYPISLSKKAIDEILKKQLNYSGLIVSDDIQMDAILKNYSFEDAIIASINAGCDLIIVGNNLKYEKDIVKKFNDIVFDAVKENKIPISRIDEAYKKIIRVKEKIN